MTVSGDRLALVVLRRQGASSTARLPDGAAAIPRARSPTSSPGPSATVRVEDAAFVIEARTRTSRRSAGPTPPRPRGLVPPADDRVPRRGPRPRGETLTGQGRGRSGGVAEDASPRSTRRSRSWAAARPSPAGWARPASRHPRRRRTSVAAIVSMPTDAAAADQLFTSLRGLLALGRRPGGITITEEDYNGTTITVVTSATSRAWIAGAAAPHGPQDLVRRDRRRSSCSASGPTSPRPCSTPARRLARAAERFTEAMAQVGASHRALFWIDVDRASAASSRRPVRRGQGRVRGGPQAVPRAFDSVIETFSRARTWTAGTVVIHLSGD